MKAISISQYGGNEVLEFVELNKPQPTSGEVLVKIAWAGVNPLDWKIRSGKMNMVVGRRFPKLLGTECSGIVEAVGSDVTDFKPGDRVICNADMAGGCYAEFIVRPAANLFPIPDKLSLKDAGGIFVTGMSAWQCLFNSGKLEPGDNVLIIGASGGVGSMAVQLAKHHGIEVTAVCSGANTDYVKLLGAPQVVDYKKEDFLGLQQQYNMVFDVMNVSSFRKAKHLLKKNGVYMNTMPGPAVFFTVLWTALLSNRKCKTLLLKPDKLHMAKIADLVADGFVLSNIHSTWPFEQVEDAIAASENMRTVGKAVIEIDGRL